MKINKIRIALHSNMFYGIVVNLNKGKAKITSKHCFFFIHNQKSNNDEPKKKLGLT